MTSLPGRGGIGDLGPGAHAFVDWLARARQTWWQILPLGPPGAGNSPYQCYSAFAGNPLLISPEALVADGLLRRTELAADGDFPDDRVHFERVGSFKNALLTQAWERFRAGAARPLRAPLERFRKAQRHWLDDFATFMALKEAQGEKSWTQWPKDLVLRKPAALADARLELADAIGRHELLQFLFFRQLESLRGRARERGVRLIGDVPIFVSGESADVWSHPELFRLDRSRRPTVVAGVPTDYFSKDGQRWGNPLYDWRAMSREGFAWWVDRVRATLAQVDLVRIDHFRGFAACWEVPAAATTAKTGRWAKTPGRELFDALKRELAALPFIAEDLGLITPDVQALRDELGLPGMRVLQFAFGGSADNPFLPHNYVPNAVAYTGTHDNDTTAGWFASLKKKEQAFVGRYAGGADGTHISWDMIRLAWSSVAAYAVAPMQDLLELGSEARMNRPGTSSGNWEWRMRPGAADAPTRDRLGELTETFGRAE